MAFLGTQWQQCGARTELHAGDRFRIKSSHFKVGKKHFLEEVKSGVKRIVKTMAGKGNPGSAPRGVPSVVRKLLKSLK